MKYAIKKEIKYFFSNYNWLLIIILFIVTGYLTINNTLYYLRELRGYLMITYHQTGDINYYNLANSKSFINIYAVMSGIYHDAIGSFNGPMTIVVLLTIIILSISSLSYCIDERNGYIKYEFLKISKNNFIIAKLLVNSIMMGIVFIIPYFLLLIFYSYSYSYDLSDINYAFCNTESICKSVTTDILFNFQYPITTLIINIIIRPFLNGVILSLTVITFSIVAKRKSTLIIFSLGFMFIYLAIYSAINRLIMLVTNSSFDNVFSKKILPYFELFSNENVSFFPAYLRSILINFIVLLGLIFVFWRKQKYDV